MNVCQFFQDFFGAETVEENDGKVTVFFRFEKDGIGSCRSRTWVEFTQEQEPEEMIKKLVRAGEFRLHVTNMA